MPGRIFRLVVCFAIFLVIGVCSQDWKASASSSDSIIKIYIDTKEVNVKTPPQIKNGTTFVPLRAVFEALQMEVIWEPKKQLATIKTVRRRLL